MFKKINVLLVASLLVLSVAGCSGRSAGTEAQAETEAAAIQTENTVDSGQEGAQAGAVGELPDLEIRFGYDGQIYHTIRPGNHHFGAGRGSVLFRAEPDDPVLP